MVRFGQGYCQLGLGLGTFAACCPRARAAASVLQQMLRSAPQAWLGLGVGFGFGFGFGLALDTGCSAPRRPAPARPPPAAA